MTRPNALVGALAAVGVGTLLWLAWLIVAADLTLGTSIAAWGLWLLVLLTATTLVAYAHELGRHRRVAGRPGSWRPLPSLVLLWIGGLTAVPVLALMLPQGREPVPARAKSTSAALSAAETAHTTSSPDATTGTPAPRATQSRAARSSDRTSTTPAHGPSTSAAPRVTTTTAPSSGSTRPTSRPSTTITTPTATTTTPVIDLTILPNGHPKTKPPRP